MKCVQHALLRKGFNGHLFVNATIGNTYTNTVNNTRPMLSYIFIYFSHSKIQSAAQALRNWEQSVLHNVHIYTNHILTRENF